jgi:MSHA type pilus biogenesis protein MshL
MKMNKNIAILMMFAFTACASVQPAGYTEQEAGRIEKETLDISRAQKTIVPTEVPAPEVPEFVPINEVISPLSNKKVSIAARMTPLRDVLHIIADTANLNLAMEKGVNPELPVTMTFSDITVKDALDILFDSVDYFYFIKDNILIVRAMGTEIIEFGQPNVIQEFSANVGGDILSGISSEGGAGSISGEVSMKSTSDQVSFKLWDTIEKSLAILLDAKTKRQSGLQPIFIVNRMTGTIMVTATKKELKRARDYIDNIKKILNRQVLIEARIVEVQMSDGLRYGIDWTAVGEWLGTGTNTLGTQLFTSVIGAADPTFQFSITENDNLTLVLKALLQQGDVKILSNPRLNIMNGQTSMLSVGRNTTFISKVETTTTIADGSSPITTFSVETNSILSGLIFGLVPYINDEGEITMTITPIVSNLVDLEAKNVGSADNFTEIKLPTVDLREMSTTVKVLDGQMIIIGGLIDKLETIKEDKVPFLGDIPIIGKAFKSVDKSYRNKELVIMLIPRIVG